MFLSLPLLNRSSRSLLKFVLPGKFFEILHLSRLQKHQNASSNPVSIKSKTVNGKQDYSKHFDVFVV